MAVEFYGARYISMFKFNIYEKHEIARLREIGFKFICKDDSYYPVNAFKREPIYTLDKKKNTGRFIIHPRSDETMDDVMLNYRDAIVKAGMDCDVPFNKMLRIGEMFDINVMVAFDCIHWKKEAEVLGDAERLKNNLLLGVDKYEDM